MKGLDVSGTAYLFLLLLNMEEMTQLQQPYYNHQESNQSMAETLTLRVLSNLLIIMTCYFVIKISSTFFKPLF